MEFADDDDCGGYGGGVDRIDVLLYSMLFPYLDFSLSRFRGGGGEKKTPTIYIYVGGWVRRIILLLLKKKVK